MAGFLSVVYGSLFPLSVLKLWLLSSGSCPGSYPSWCRRVPVFLHWSVRTAASLPSFARHPRSHPRSRLTASSVIKPIATGASIGREGRTSPSAPSASCTSATSWSASTTVPSNASSSGSATRSVAHFARVALRVRGQARPRRTVRRRHRRRDLEGDDRRARKRPTGPGRNHTAAGAAARSVGGRVHRRSRSLARQSSSNPGFDPRLDPTTQSLDRAGVVRRSSSIRASADGSSGTLMNRTSPFAAGLRASSAGWPERSAS